MNEILDKMDHNALQSLMINIQDRLSLMDADLVNYNEEENAFEFRELENADIGQDQETSDS